MACIRALRVFRGRLRAVRGYTQWYVEALSPTAPRRGRGAVRADGGSAGLQYRWLGQIAEAERERLKSVMTTGAHGVCVGLRSRGDARVSAVSNRRRRSRVAANAGAPKRFAARYDRWQATGALSSLRSKSSTHSNRTSTRRAHCTCAASIPRAARLEEVPGPRHGGLARTALYRPLKDRPRGSTVFIRRMPALIWETMCRRSSCPRR